jgi:RNA-directed DNA polymerase
MRIAKAVRRGRFHLVKKLQKILSRSLSARLLAVRRVTKNRGSRTPGVDRILWNGSGKKIQAVEMLKQYRRYKPLPLRRVYLRKKNGKLRPLGIPVMKDRAMQAVHALTLTPVAETTADRHSYGFRPLRSCADAISQCFNLLSRGYSPQWVLEGDICGCFDNISQPWMLDNVPMDRRMLEAWLNAGYMEKGKLFPTTTGTPQGGVISPILANMVLDGLENACYETVNLNPQSSARRKAKLNVVRYADDFIVTANSRELLSEKIIPAIKAFLKERGLSLSEEKTKITQVTDGFDFLGQNIRKQDNTLHIRPSMGAVKSLLAKTREIMQKLLVDNPWELIGKLNPVIRGWANYHRHIYASETFSHVDSCIFWQLWCWVRKRNRSKGKKWYKKKYFTNHEGRAWTFCANRTENGKVRTRTLVIASRTKTVPYVKIRSEANPFDPQWEEYFAKRKALKKWANRKSKVGVPCTIASEQPGRLPKVSGLNNA